MDLQQWILTLLPSWFKIPSRPMIRHVIYGIFLGFSLSLVSTSIALFFQRRKQERIAAQFEPRPIELRSDEVLKGVTGLIGNTPLVRINSLSNALGIEILAKAEFLNPGGSVKDRVALRMIDDAEREGLIHPHTGSRIFEGTVGSTGISIATIARARGYDATIIMPDDVAQEKVQALLSLGAEVQRVRPASIVDKKQVGIYNIARQRALEFGKEEPCSRPHLVSSSSSTVVVLTGDDDDTDPLKHEQFVLKPRGYFADQFENLSNFNAHFEGTGPEIWRQTNGRLNAFVSGAGTIAGIGRYVKSMNEDVVVALTDPEGSGLYNKVKHDVMFDSRESEGTKRRHQVDTVVEGIGINRLTKNIELALPIIDDAFRITDAEAVSMSRYLVQNDGLFLGSSSACNLVACIKLAKKMGWKEGQTIVTVLCDSGNRHYSKVSLANDEYLAKAGISADMSIVEGLLLQPPA
ncbi:PALP-domain-containing protein [Guyanagaster necrorhizus]|uniref:cysteine synthase n=1 Tax=Guyanagaster necrorhizus TaxID=856835 RepID=A0A9P7VN43_9AGAR|nr:PALP-domain-containing protein [Guyanagaster necrorhizus MCA 3950]KAG7442961.1 PALP-domain-containing protein [Guyanagaster necrorhizus MCA 3950]